MSWPPDSARGTREWLTPARREALVIAVRLARARCQVEDAEFEPYPPVTALVRRC